MTPDRMAALHAAAFRHERAWTAGEFTQLLAQNHTHVCVHAQGFALTRTLAGESELLTLAVDPAHHRQGIARTLMHDWLTALQNTAETAFLEVASDNHGARALYAHFGFEQVAVRTGYYMRKDAAAVDALILRRNVTLGQTVDITPDLPESG